MRRLLLVILLFTSINSYSQTLGDYFIAIYNKKQVFDKKLDSYMSIKTLYSDPCPEQDGFNEKINSKLILGVKRRDCGADSTCAFFYYIYNTEFKETHVLTTYPTYEYDIKSDVSSITDIHIFDSLYYKRYCFFIFGPDDYTLTKFKKINSQASHKKKQLEYNDWIREKMKRVSRYSETGIFISPDSRLTNDTTLVYVKIDKVISELTLDEYFKLIELLKIDVESGFVQSDRHLKK